MLFIHTLTKSNFLAEKKIKNKKKPGQFLCYVDETSPDLEIVTKVYVSWPVSKIWALPIYLITSRICATNWKCTLNNVFFFFWTIHQTAGHTSGESSVAPYNPFHTLYGSHGVIAHWFCKCKRLSTIKHKSTTYLHISAHSDKVASWGRGGSKW